MFTAYNKITMIRILFLCLISTKHALAQTVSWTVGTSVPRFNEDLKLVCTVSTACCTSSDRIWADSNGNQILNNGNSASPNKYEEDWDGGTTGFSLIIKNLQLSDVGVDYDCQYSLGKDQHTLTQDATWEYPLSSENCPIKWSEGYLNGEFIIERSAPSPTFLASFRGINVTSDLTIKEKTSFDTWFYSMTVEIKKIISCSNDDRFTLSVITGTTTTKICDAKIVCGLCPSCLGRCFAWGALGIVIAGLLWIGVGCLYCAYMNKENGKVLKAVSISGLVFLAIDFCTAIPIGLVGCFCYDFNDTLNDIEYHKDPLFTLIAISAIFAIFIGLLLWCKDHKIDEYHAWIFFGVITYGIGLLICKYSDVFIEKINAIIGGTARLLCPYKADSGQITWIKLNGNLRETYSDGTAISQDLPHNLRDRLNVEGRDLCISNVQESDAGIYECVFTPKPDKVPLGSKLKLIVSAGGINRSTESGSSCWPPCSVGQDPNSPDPENARSLLRKKKADKNTEEKPVAVVRSQPQKARHVMTDNTESAKYSAENEKFSAGLVKGQKPRPLPSIGQPIDSPRPLPQMPRSTQQEKGGIQLQPLGDSTSEKKKKKKRKKEIKNSDEED